MVHSYAKRVFFLAVCLGFLGSLATGASAGDAEKCRAAELGAAGKACSTIFKKCYGPSAKGGMPVDMICMSDTLVTLLADLDKAEAAGGCEHTRLSASIWERLGGLADDVANGELVFRTGGVCAAKKLKAVAKVCQSFGKCYAASAKESADVTPAAGCLADASGKFSAAFTKIESVMTCTPVDNADSIEALVGSAFVDLSDLSTTGTTSTTLPPSP
ncbi:MAG TPA: hypothetical protein VN634_10340 [Candidatus Limnocylindrales bacterium]|nr:hypothetical protein [Candidatus Limnocylindrales bacterium]